MVHNYRTISLFKSVSLDYNIHIDHNWKLNTVQTI